MSTQNSQPENRAGGDQKTDNSSFAAAPSITLPKGGGAIRGIGEKFAANPVTGTGSMSVPIAVSPGRSGFGPQLNLSYDSGSGNGPFGFGWSLSLPSIARKTDKGLPQYLDAEESDVYILSGSEDLVPVDEDDITVKDPNTFISYLVHRFRPRVEGLFARIERWTNASTREIHWRSISRDNITTLYGATNSSRIFDPSDPDFDPAAPDLYHPARIFSWLICASYDDKGNAIVYEYAPEDSAGVDAGQAHERNRTDSSRSANRYLKRILYGNRTSNRDPNGQAIDPATLTDWMFEVVFDYDEGHVQPLSASGDDPFYLIAGLDPAQPWTARQDPFSAYRAAFEVRTYRLCRRALMFHHFPVELGAPDCLVRSTEFSYAESPIASFITGITQAGYLLQPDAVNPNRYLQKSLPPLEFEYTDVPDASELAQRPIEEVDPQSLENLPAGLDGVHSQWMDLDGEGISGILTEQADGWYYKRNLSANNQVEENGNERTVACFDPAEAVTRKPTGGLTGGAQFLDITGDGQADLALMEGPVRGFYERTDDADWELFQPFAAFPELATRDPNLKFVDLTGDGHADILITESDTLIWYPSLGGEGYGPGVRLHLPPDEERGPRLVFADGTQSIFLADVSGEGLSDLVRVRNAEICYWPNLGYGRFGAKVTMDHAPQLDSCDQFDPQRIRLADIDGSGTTDILYLHRTGVRIYFNQCGNSWSDAAELPQFPPVEDLSSIQALDLLGNGTACLVWSSPLPGSATRPMRYLALMLEKPHLLVKAANNLGAETIIHYAPSTKYYLQDKLAGNPWITRLPFPVHVVERVETYDRISRNRFVARYAYHHGFFDGVEREFRGFGLVEQWDTEEIGTVAPGTVAPDDSNWDPASFVPPVLTRTWFHTGAFFEGAQISKQFEDAYYREGDASRGESGLSDSQLEAMLLSDTVLPTTIRLAGGTQTPYALTGDEAREACRSLKGSILRQEIYGLDGTDKADRPYSVSERNYTIELLQPQGSHPYAVFFTHARETVDFHYERELYEVSGGECADPRVTHALTLATDDYGNVLQSVAIGYGRRFADPSLGTDEASKQTEALFTYTGNKYTNPVPDSNAPNPVTDADSYRIPLLCESRTFELWNVAPAASSGAGNMTGITNLYSFEDMAALAQIVCDGNHDLPYEDINHAQAKTSDPYRRLIEQVRTLFRADDLTGLLPLGRMEALALPGETCKLAFTPGLLAQIFTRTLNGSSAENLLPDPAAVLGGTGADQGGYRSSQDLRGQNLFPADAADPWWTASDADDYWWIPSGCVFYSPDSGDTAAAELSFARGHFFLPHRFVDPFGNATCLAYDSDSTDLARNHNLLPVETKDPLGNCVTVLTQDDAGHAEIRNDYRVLQPAWVTDPNGNRSLAAFDALGLVVATAVMGKPGENKGDLLDNAFEPDLTLAQIQSFVENPYGEAPGLLASASTRIIYDIDRYQRCQQPPFAAALAREVHARDPGGESSPVQIHFVYSDGFGREIQTKVQAEPGDVPQRAAAVPLPDGDIQPGGLVRDAGGNIVEANSAPRWVGTGRTVFNNKGKSVKKYEPFFSSTHLYESEPDMTDTGVTPVLFYDPAERVIATLQPDHTYEKVVFDPWMQRSWDGNDTVAGEPNADEDIGGYVAAYFSAQPAGWQTWLQQRVSDPTHPPVDTLGQNPEQDAAVRTLAHADTPATAYFDTLGRTFLTVADNGAAGKFQTRVEIDIEGNQRTVIDALGREVMAYDYDMLGNRIRQASMEAGERWMLGDASGKPIRAWDSRKFNRRMNYDALRRPTGLYVAENGIERLAEQTVYGEGQGNANNLRTRAYRVFDGAGVVTNVTYDFKGNLLSGQRDLLPDYQQAVDWLQNPAASDGTFTSGTAYDALNRPTAVTAPDGSVYRPSYNEANLLERVDVNLRGAETAAPFVTNIDYNAKGQRTLIQYANGADTVYEYDEETFRLIHLQTTRPAGLNGLATQLFDDPGKVQDLHYTFDPVGNITNIADAAIPMITYNNQSVDPNADYIYDAIYRLLSAKGREHIDQTAFDFIPPDGNYRDYPFVGLQASPNDPQALRNYAETYAYDEVGNIQSVQHAAAGGSWTRAYTYTEPSLLEAGKNNNRLTRTDVGNTPEVYSYRDAQGQDADGCMTAINSISMTWDFKDELQTVDLGGGGTACYVYDAAGQRARKVIQRLNGSRQKERIYLGGFEIYREYDGAGETIDLERETLHVMDDKQRIALVETRTQGDDGSPAQLIRYQINNHLGSAALELDDQVQIISYEEYSPYGGTSFQMARSDAEVSRKRYRFTGKERDEETGLNYHGARYYAPWLGRWTSPDPIGLTGGLNLFGYAGGCPIRFVDTAGTDPDEPGKLPWYKKIQVATMEAGRQVAQRVSGVVSLLDDPGAVVTGMAEQVSVRYQVYRAGGPGLSKTPVAAAANALNDVLSPLAHARRAADRAALADERGDDKTMIQEKTSEVASIIDALLVVRSLAGGVGRIAPSESISDTAETTTETTSSGAEATDARLPKELATLDSPAPRAPANQVIVSPGTNNIVSPSALLMAQRTGQTLRAAGPGVLASADEATLVAHGLSRSGTMGSSAIDLGSRYGALTPPKLAQVLVNEMGWRGGSLRLAACNTGVNVPGQGSYGLRLSQELSKLDSPTTVIAPYGSVSVFGGGGLPAVLTPGNTEILKLGKGWNYYEPPK